MILLADVVEKAAKRGRHGCRIGFEDLRTNEVGRIACAARELDVEARLEASSNCECLKRPVRAIEAILSLS